MPGVIHRTFERGSKRRHNAEKKESETDVDSGFYSRAYSLNVLESHRGREKNVKVKYYESATPSCDFSNSPYKSVPSKPC